MSTKFVLTKLDVNLPDKTKLSFWFDGNGKITVGNGSYDKPAVNSFSLIQIQDCPFATNICKSVCFVHNLEKKEAEVHEKYRQNSITIRKALNCSAYLEIVENAFAGWIKSNCLRGFRWHVSGDIFSLDYARFIRNVSLKAKPILCWLYTRSFVYVEPLLGIHNLVINLSVDKENWSEAAMLHQKYGLRLCYLTVEGEVPELPPGSVIFPSYELRGRDLAKPTDALWWQTLTLNQKRMVCPPDFFGQSEQHRCGPCKKCLF